MSRAELARRQAELVEALVAGGPIPAGFDEEAVRVAAAALLRKRSDEVAGAWPELSGSFGRHWTVAFGRWAADRPPGGSLRDGWDFALRMAEAGALSKASTVELAARRAAYRYDGSEPPRARRGLAFQRAGGSVVVQVFARLLVWRR